MFDFIKGGKLKRGLKLLRIIKKNPGLTLTEISEKADLQIQKASIYIGGFKQNGWLTEEIAGKEKHLYLNDAGRAAFKQLKGLSRTKGFIGKAAKYI